MNLLKKAREGKKPDSTVYRNNAPLILNNLIT